MFLHSGDPLKSETRCVYHEGEFCRIDPLDVVTFYSNDEKDEKD